MTAKCNFHPGRIGGGQLGVKRRKENTVISESRTADVRGHSGVFRRIRRRPRRLACFERWF